MTKSLLDTLSITSEKGRASVSVPWEHANDLYTYLNTRGYPATLWLDSSSHKAWLELWENVNPKEALASLDELPPDESTWVILSSRTIDRR